ncbi:MAG: helix-turn-helix domain-containing protein [Anaerovoracaceae bacterium]
MNVNKLKGKMAEAGINQNELADKMGLSRNSVSRKLTGSSEFTLSEAEKICIILDINEPKGIFFEKAFPNTQREV